MSELIKQSARKNILIVDDKPDNLRLLSAMLTEQGYKVRSVINGAMALIGVRAAPPDLILLDINMPEMNGFEVCEQLKADAQTTDIPVIFISALDEVLDKIQAFAVGGIDYITKPFQMQEVLARVENQLRIQELQQALQQLNAELEQRIEERTQQLKAEVIERRQAQARLVHMATHDALTDLPNRTLFIEQLEKALNAVKLTPAHYCAVLFLDCDRFKLVNDSLGHLLGDQLLLAIAARLDRLSQGRATMLARLGGDEFTLLLTALNDSAPAEALAEDIQHAFARPFVLESHNIFINVSIGIALGTADYAQASFMLRDADTAMYRAKAMPSSAYQMFAPSMHTASHRRLQLENDLRHALERDEFVLHYQPIMCLASKQLQGFEALVRWEHPTQGLISPQEFIPLCEETGLILPLGEWVLTTACQQLYRWRCRYPAAEALTLSVNFSACQFATSYDLVALIGNILQQTHLPAQCLKIEMTESVLMDTVDSAAQVLQQLQALAISISIDDFGTGYSSLSYLAQFPLNELKIDRCFIQRLTDMNDNHLIVKAVIELGHTLGLTVVAEGIESEPQWHWLVQHGCDLGQGYWFSKPLIMQDAESCVQQYALSSS